EAYPHYSSSMTDDSPCNYDAEGKKDQPMNCVTWYGADAYCKWIGGRLPTEAEWEKAARGTAGRKYPWGNEPAVSCDYAVMGPHNDSTGEYDDGCGTGGTMPVGSKPNGVSPYGAYDMIGNVWEWVHDWCCSDYSIYSSLANNPKGPISGDQRMMRGGAWKSSYDEVLRASARRYGSPTYKSGDIGLRCAK
ncbi:MAG TPA: SUMF1/EgtB/PvdO family nonheme iron enzyme, partial [bacterium]|nr:SUMF1/EgtB/PvdO family nonheme iron enzyme [bacterium]